MVYHRLKFRRYPGWFLLGPEELYKISKQVGVKKNVKGWSEGNNQSIVLSINSIMAWWYLMDYYDDLNVLIME